jgi:hypothetical protein
MKERSALFELALGISTDILRHLQNGGEAEVAKKSPCLTLKGGILIDTTF